MITLKAINILALTIEFYHWWLMFLAQIAPHKVNNIHTPSS